MLSRLLLISTIVMISALTTFGEDTAPATTLQVYPVADLVSIGTFQESIQDEITAKEWRSASEESIQALDRLASLVTVMCSSKVAKVEPYPTTMSLVVRDTAEGHVETAKLLKLLRKGSEPSIQLTCQPLNNLRDSFGQHLSDEERSRANGFLTKKVLTSDEVKEVMELLRRPGDEVFDQTLKLVAGCKTAWGIPGRPAMATASAIPGKQTIRVRMDYITDDIGEKIPVASQVFELKSGTSTISFQHCDGGTTVWLITPTFLPAIAAD